MVPKAANQLMNQPLLTEGRQVWNGIHQSVRISNWKAPIGTVNFLTLSVDRKFLFLDIQNLFCPSFLCPDHARG